ncbi:MAG: hypothetical protein ACXWR1_21730 [Bdellovibrionota bacterium]
MKFPFRLRSPRIAISLVCLFALTACDIYPDSGKWAGDVSVHDDLWTQHYSCSLDVDITHTDEVVSLNSFDSFCGDGTLHWAPPALNRHGDSLYLGDQEVGAVEADGTIHIQFDNPYFTAQYPHQVDQVIVTWTRVGEDLVVDVTEVNQGRQLIMESTLHRLQ